jgi:hypothetical protein
MAQVSYHLQRGLVQLDKDGRVDLVQTQQLQNLAGLGRDLVDALDARNQSEFLLGLDKEGAGSLGLASEADQVALLGQIFRRVLLGTLERQSTALHVNSLLGYGCSRTCFRAFLRSAETTAWAA